MIDSNRPPKVKKEKKVKVKKVKPARSQTSKTKVRKIETVEIEKKQDIQIKDHYEEEHKVEDNEIQDNKIVYKEVEVDKNDIINPLQKEHTNIVRNEKVVEEKVDEEERESFLHRITKPFRATIQRIKEVIRKVREVIRSARNIFSNVKAKIHLVKDFLEVEDNRKGLGRVYAGIKKILKHILPYKVKGFVRFGLDDPCNTGYLLGVLSLVYPIYANKIQIIPDFQEEVLEGQVDAKGRIRAFTLLIIGIKLILDDNFKKLLKNVKELKEEF